MMDLRTFLSCLQGVKPLVCRKLILEGDLLTPSQRKDLHDRDAYFLDTVVVVGPTAGRAILDAYKAGQLPMRRSSEKPSETPKADAYLAESDRWTQEIAERYRLKCAVGDTSLIRSEDLFNYRLLDEVFVRHLGLGRGTLTLAGVQVTKSLLEYRSNSGKSVDWKVSFSWRDKNNQRHTVGKESRYAENRRNDAERDWGLPD